MHCSMKTYYYFRAQNEPLAAGSVIYKIAVGSSERDDSYLGRWKQICYERGYTFTIWDESVMFYLDYERERVFGDACPVSHRFLLVTMNLRQLSHIYRTCGFAFFEASVKPSKMYFKQMRCLFPAYFFNRIFSKKSQNVPSGTRKYLSRSLRKSEVSVQV